MNVYQIMARNYKNRCEALGLSHEDVAERSGVDVNTVQRLAEEKPIRIMPVVRICKAIDYPLGDFLEWQK